MPRKLRAFLIHLAISLLVVGGFIGIVYFVWYPNPLLALQGGITIVGILIMVDVIVGPLLTFMVFKPGKKWLILDLMVIAIIQACAFAYGAWIIYSERPAFLVFSNNQFYVVRQGDLEGTPPSTIASAPRYGVTGPLIVFARISEQEEHDPVVLLSAILGDPGLALKAQTYEPFPYSMTKLARETLPPKDVVADVGEDVLRLAANMGKKPEALYYYHLKGRAAYGLAVVDPESQQLVGIVAHNLKSTTFGGKPATR